MRKRYVFFVAGMGISEENRRDLAALAQSYGRSCEIISIESMKEYLNFDFDTSGWNEIVLARLFVDRLLPEGLDRVLYLDGDTIVRGSLHKLWNMDMRGKTLAMSIETTAEKRRKDELGLGGRYYYNAGVLLIDLKKWRDRACGERIVSYYREHAGRLFANDQDAINAVLKDEIRPMLPKYNFCNTYTQYPYRMLCRLVKPMRYVPEKRYRECKENPVIIHYLGEERPWRKGNTHKYRSDYKRYLSMTKWHDTPDEEGWELYFLAWRCFQTVLKPFPMARYRIINGLIPLMLRIRSKHK